MNGCVNSQQALVQGLAPQETAITADPCFSAFTASRGGTDFDRPTMSGHAQYARAKSNGAPCGKAIPHSQDHYVWAAELQGRVVGMIDLVREGPHVARIRRLRVDPAWQHTAVLNKLIQRVHDYCWDQGCMKLVLDAGSTPRWILRLLERLGCQVVERDGAMAKNVLELYLDLYHCRSLHETSRASHGPAA